MGYGIGCVVIGVICAFIGFTIGEKKSLGGPASAILCFFLPLIGLIIVLVLPDEEGALRSDDFRRNLDRAGRGLRRTGRRARDSFNRGRERGRRRRDNYDDDDY